MPTSTDEEDENLGILRLVDEMAQKDNADRALTFILRRLGQHADSTGRNVQRIYEQNETVKGKLDELSGSVVQFIAKAEENQASLLRLSDEQRRLAHRVERVRARVKSITEDEITDRHGSQNISMATPLQAIPIQQLQMPTNTGPTRSEIPKTVRKEIDDEVNRRVTKFVVAAAAAVGGAIAGGIGTALLSQFMSHVH